MTFLVRRLAIAMGVAILFLAPLRADAQDEDDMELEVPAEPEQEPPAAAPGQDKDDTDFEVSPEPEPETPASARSQDEEDMELEVSAEPEPETPAAAPTADELTELREELARLRARIDELELEATAKKVEEKEVRPPRTSVFGGVESSPTAALRQPLAVRTRMRTFHAPRGFSIAGYIQAEYQWHADSEDQLFPGGLPINQDRFLIRRGRMRFRGVYENFAAELELDANTVLGFNVGVIRAHVSALLRGKEKDAPPLIAATVGLTAIPFGLEIQIGQEEFIFMERSTGSLALFPGSTDIGAVLSGGYGPLRYDIGVMNGTPIDERTGTLLREPTRAPDFVGRLGVEVKPRESFELVAGLSYLSGKGFHSGQDATENGIQWVDINSDGVLQPGTELFAVPGQAATPSKTFQRWAVGADVAFAVYTKKGGATRVYGEIIMATNLDRGFLVADPIEAGADIREVQGYAAILQDVTRWGIVGFRYDYYDPNSDILDAQQGVLVPSSAKIQTFSPVGGLRWPGRARLLFQYDAVVDNLGRDASGRTTDLRNNRFTVRVQGEF